MRKKRKNIVNAVVFFVLAVLSLLFSFFASSDAANSNGFYNSYVKPILAHKISIILVLFLLFLILTIFQLYESSQAQDIEDLKSENKEFREIVENKSLNLLTNLKELVELHKKEKIFNTIKNFTLSKPYIIAIQIYKYDFYHTKGKTKYTINYSDGFVRDEEEENCISQMVYIMPRSVTNKFSEAYMDYIINDNPTKLRNFLEKNISKLNRKSTDSITNEDCNIFALVQYSIQVLGEDESDSTLLHILDDDDKERYIQNKRRTGILSGIINQDFYRFYYQGKNDRKSGRSYVTFCKEIGNINYMFLTTLSPAIDLNNDSDLPRQYVEQFSECLHSLECNI